MQRPKYSESLLCSILRCSLSLLLVLLANFSNPSVCRADGRSIHKDAVDAYMRRDYKTAAYLFEACASSNTNTVGSCLFAGHSYAYAGNRDKAIAMYRRVCEIAPGSNEAKVAEGYLAKLGAPR